MADRTTEIRIKIERAKEHVEDLAVEIAAFLGQADPYEFIAEDDPKSGQKIYRVKIVAEIPLRWSALIGDAIHNARASLDMLIYQLVLANHETPTDRTRFPIHRNSNEFEGGRTPGEIKGVSDAAVKLIKAIKPYKGGSEPLWILHRLDITDKHYVLLLTLLAYRNFTADLHPGGFVYFDMSRPGNPLEDDAIIVGGGQRDMDVKPQFTVYVAFSKVEGVEGQPVLPTLQYFVQMVEAIVQRFRPLLA